MEIVGYYFAQVGLLVRINDFPSHFLICEYLNNINPEYFLNQAGRNQHHWIPLGLEHPNFSRSWIECKTEEDRAGQLMALAFSMPLWLKENGYPDEHSSSFINNIIGDQHDIISRQDLEKNLSNIEFGHSLILSWSEFDIWSVLTSTAFFYAI